MTTQRVLTLGNYTCWLPGWVGPTYSSALGQKLARSWVLRLKASTICVRWPWIVLVKQHWMFPLSLVINLLPPNCEFKKWPLQLLPHVGPHSFTLRYWQHFPLWGVVHELLSSDYITYEKSLHIGPPYTHALCVCVHIPALLSRFCIIRSM